MTLLQAPQGEPVLVIRVTAETKIRKHLENLGITSGAEFTKLSASDGNMIVRVHGSRIALNRDLAETIVVRKVPIFA